MIRLVILILSFFASICNAIGETFDVEMKFDCTEDHELVTIYLTNISDAKVTMTYDNMPWFPASLAFHAYAKIGTNNLKKISPIGHDNTPVVLNKKQVVSGTINLLWVFPDLLETLKDNAVTLHWRYHPISEQQRSLGSYSGSLFLPQNCWGKTTPD